MNKVKLEELTRKYFFEQKREELKIVFIALFVIWSILGVFFQIGWDCERMPDNYPTCDSHTSGIPQCDCKFPYEPTFPYWMMYSGIITTSFWIVFGIVYGLNYWIKSNWKRATLRAKIDLGIK